MRRGGIKQIAYREINGITHAASETMGELKKMAVTIHIAGTWRNYRFTGQGYGLNLLVAELRRRVAAAGGVPGSAESDRRLHVKRRKLNHRVCLAFSSIIFLGMSVALWYAELERRENIALRANGVRVTGEIVRLEPGIRAQATYRFVDAKGNAHEKSIHYPKAKAQEASDGDAIEILYLPANPEISAYELEELSVLYACMLLFAIYFVGSLIVTVILCFGYYISASPGKIWLLRPGETLEDRITIGGKRG